MPIDFSITSTVLANGRTTYSAQRNNSAEPKFIIGSRTSYEGNFGLFNTAITAGQVYKPEDYETEFGFWAHFIYPTAMAESSGSYKCLNTYDRAKLTFSFMQYAAHVPNGDFIKFFKKLLQLPVAQEYFPKLKLQDNRIFYQATNGTMTQLENDITSQPLMDYLNPTLNDVENQELICCARLVHWSANDVTHRKIQVQTAIELFRDNMKSYNNRFGLDKVPAKVCLMICDIKHQGRGTNDRIANALNTNGNYEKAYINLCSIGATNYQTRINTVKNTINKLIVLGKFNLKYDAKTGTFM
jgi:hypothetical protein